MCGRYYWLTTRTPIPFFFFFFHLSSSILENLKLRSLCFSDSIFTIDDPVTQLWPWDITIEICWYHLFSSLLSAACNIEAIPELYQSLVRTTEEKSKGPAFFMVLLNSCTAHRPTSCLHTTFCYINQLLFSHHLLGFLILSIECNPNQHSTNNTSQFTCVYLNTVIIIHSFECMQIQYTSLRV